AYRRQRGGRIDIADAKHGGGVKAAAMAVAHLILRSRLCSDISIARAIDEGVGANRLTPGLGLDDEVLDTAALLDHRRRMRVEKNLHPMAQQHLIGRAFISRGIVGAHAYAPLHAVLWLVEAAEFVQTFEELIDHAVDQLHHLAIAATVQAGE